MTGDGRPKSSGTEDGSAGGTRFLSVLRLAAVALVVGFSGWLIDHDGELVLESPFTVAFAAGVACALVSIYLGVFLANGDEE